MFEKSLYDICFPSIVEEVSRSNSRNHADKFFECFSEFYLLIFSEIIDIHRNYDHSLTCFFAASDDEVTPESYACFDIIGWDAIFPGKCIKSCKYIINHFISEDTIGTIHDTVKLTRFMKTKTIVIMDSFASGDVFSPAKFYLVPIAIDLWRSNNGMPCYPLNHLWMVCENFSHLLFFYLKLFFVWYWEPSTPSIDLKFVRELGFEWGFFYHAKELSLETI